jgi:hypothetical protein
VFGAATKYRTLPMAGEYIIIMEFDGRNISGSLRTIDGITGGEHGTPNPGKFMGTRDGATCRLSWADGSNSVAYCGRTEYRENINSPATGGDAKMAYAVQGRVTETVDYVERDRQRAAAAAAAADQERRLAASANQPVKLTRRPDPPKRPTVPAVAKARPEPRGSLTAMADRCVSLSANSTRTSIYIPNLAQGYRNTGFTSDRTTVRYTCGAIPGHTHIRIWLTLGVKNGNSCEKGRPDDDPDVKANFVFTASGYDNLVSVDNRGIFNCISSISKWEPNSTVSIE